MRRRWVVLERELRTNLSACAIALWAITNHMSRTTRRCGSNLAQLESTRFQSEGEFGNDGAPTLGRRTF
jgi:hypothetical protein